MNKKIILILVILSILILSGCVDRGIPSRNLSGDIQDTTPVPTPDVIKTTTYGDGYQVYSIYPVIYGDRIEVIFPNNVGKYSYSSTFLKFKDENNICYVDLGSAAAGNSISCVKNQT